MSWKRIIDLKQNHQGSAVVVVIDQLLSVIDLHSEIQKAISNNVMKIKDPGSQNNEKLSENSD